MLFTKYIHPKHYYFLIYQAQCVLTPFFVSYYVVHNNKNYIILLDFFFI